MKTRIFFLLVILVFTSQLAPAQNRPVWDPQKTWVFMVGLVEWEDDEEFEPFPQEGRQDEVLLDVLKQRGVAENRIVYLKDAQATTARIKTEFIKLLSRTRPGDWVIVYFEGHGYKDDDNARTFLASYDASDEAEGWAVDSIPTTIEKNFKGSHAIIALDNCYSGAMARAVKAAPRKISYAVLASSLASQESTGNWTFTEAIISAFHGAPYTDDDNDGKITFFELGENAKEDMLFGEEQVATIAFTGSFDPQTVIGDSTGRAAPRVGERIEAYSEDDWYKGFITEARRGEFKVHYYGYEDTDDEWVPARLVREPKVARYAVGQKVEVEWQKKWYAARILRVKGGSHYVTYIGFGKQWNEWVSSKRIRRT